MMKARALQVVACSEVNPMLGHRKTNQEETGAVTARRLRLSVGQEEEGSGETAAGAGCQEEAFPLRGEEVVYTNYQNEVEKVKEQGEVVEEDEEEEETGREGDEDVDDEFSEDNEAGGERTT
ncbi:hypothetical protein F7725_020007 [Dissostichus mawsoni]|uniref:Uncharacterized protein n=1 Tax=Dissostichus mawsoni TaxID=36200 RepID=A0A7J5YPV6_DISMA|nr:hypothetical protein F7725_020007 [Dissostichus mawsoni]